MQQNYLTTKFPTAASAPVGTGGAQWTNPTNILVNDAASATLTLSGTFSASIIASGFNPTFPPGAVIDGISVYIDVPTQTGTWNSITLSMDNVSGVTAKSFLSASGTKGGATDLWGASAITAADLSDVQFTLTAGGISGAVLSVNYISVTIYYHIDLNGTYMHVPDRVDYKVYSSAGNYLGRLPKVTSKFAFAQDENTAGSTIQITCGTKAENIETAEPLVTETGASILANDGFPLLAGATSTVFARGSDPDDAIFKNGNRVQVWLYNFWYPNGKLMFSGQINRVGFKYGGGDSTVKLLVWSDGYDLSNYYARGYPFLYTQDQAQTATTGTDTVQQPTTTNYAKWGQTFVVGAGVTNVAAITLKVNGTGDVTVGLYDAPNGTLLGTTTQHVANGAAADVQFGFSQAVNVTAGKTYFFGVSVAVGQTVDLSYTTNGAAYSSGASYLGFSSLGGGIYVISSGVLYFKTFSGVPTTTTTYSSQDPISGMLHGALLDYNSRGGLITERTFIGTGQSLTYTFNQQTINDVKDKVLEMVPTGYYCYIDLGLAKMDVKPQSTTADFTLVRGRDPIELDFALSIEQVKNYLLFNGGPAPTTNLYKAYQDSQSSTNYGIRSDSKTDNRVTLSATADAIGTTYIADNSSESEETSISVPVTAMDHTLLTPGKTIGFRNFDSFIDSLVLRIVRREWEARNVKLTLGQLPVRMSDRVQQINRGLLNEQTLSNPTAPS